MKVAIIGSGISGLVAAYRLYSEHDISVFEANDYAGGHTNTVEVQLDDERHAIDTGFIVFNSWTYPRFESLLRELGVATQPTTMSFSVRDDQQRLEYCGHSLNSLFSQRRNLWRPGFHRMVADILRFNLAAQRRLEGECQGETVGEFVARERFSAEFLRHYLLPMGAAIWSCPTGVFAEFPIRFIAEFYHNHGLLNLIRRPTWRVVTGGARNYVRAMTREFPAAIRLSTPIQRVYRRAEGVIVETRQGSCELYDHVIFACHSDQALRVLGSEASATERELLSAFPYRRNVAVLHTDASLLPERRRAWASWNYRIGSDDAAPPCVTYNMNLLQNLRSRHTFCVTLNGEARIAPEKVLKRFEYHHPVFTTLRAAAQARHSELLTANRTSFCGAYWRNGFHEDGVVSAQAVVEAIRAHYGAASSNVARHALPMQSPAGVGE